MTASILYDSDRLLHHKRMPKVRTRSISKTFPDGTEALRDIDLEVRDGELVALVGPSGCGKTTLLRIISGLEKPSRGELFFDEKEVTQLPPDKRDLGMVFQNYALFPHLSIYRNILLGLENSSLSKSEKQSIIYQVSESLGINSLLERKPSEISGGQRQRVALARLLARNPSIHLLDEPLSNLDANLRVQMRKELIELHRKYRKTTLFVTHDQVEAMTLGERICVLNHGSVEQIGTPREIYNTPKNLFVAGFFGIPSINLIPGKIEADFHQQKSYFHCNGSSVKFELPSIIKLDGQELILGIRPENIQLDKENKGNHFEVLRYEYHGDSQVITLENEGVTITSKLNSFPFLEGEQACVTFDRDSVLWFDPQSGKRIQLNDN